MLRLTLNTCCAACAYPLRGLASNRCPECGRPFDPKDPATFTHYLADGRLILLWSAIGAALLASPFLILFLCIALEPLLDLIPEFARFKTGMFFGICGIVIIAAGWLICRETSLEAWRALRNPAVLIRKRPLAWLACALSTLAYILPALTLALALLGSLYMSLRT